jgi:hypothetical protein
VGNADTRIRARDEFDRRRANGATRHYLESLLKDSTLPKNDENIMATSIRRIQMPAFQFYRYFLGIRPNADWYPAVQRIARSLGQPVRLDLLRLTLCVIAEVGERDSFIAGRFVGRFATKRSIRFRSISAA